MQRALLRLSLATFVGLGPWPKHGGQQKKTIQNHAMPPPAVMLCTHLCNLEQKADSWSASTAAAGQSRALGRGDGLWRCTSECSIDL